jgi:hypothetical protein
MDEPEKPTENRSRSCSAMKKPTVTVESLSTPQARLELLAAGANALLVETGRLGLEKSQELRRLVHDAEKVAREVERDRDRAAELERRRLAAEDRARLPAAHDAA